MANVSASLGIADKIDKAIQPLLKEKQKKLHAVLPARFGIEAREHLIESKFKDILKAQEAVNGFLVILSRKKGDTDVDLIYRAALKSEKIYLGVSDEVYEHKQHVWELIKGVIPGRDQLTDYAIANMQNDFAILSGAIATKVVERAEERLDYTGKKDYWEMLYGEETMKHARDFGPAKKRKLIGRLDKIFSLLGGFSEMEDTGRILDIYYRMEKERLPPQFLKPVKAIVDESVQVIIEEGSKLQLLCFYSFFTAVIGNCRMTLASKRGKRGPIDPHSPTGYIW